MITTSHEEAPRFVDNNCDAHLMIDEVSLENNAIKCKCSILAGTDPAQIGRPVTDWFKYDGKGAGMALNVAEACGLITREQRAQAQSTGVGISFDEALLKGRQFCAKVRLERPQVKNPATGEYTDDMSKPLYARIGFDSFSVWDQKAKAIPKDLQFLAMLPRPAGWTDAQLQQWAKGIGQMPGVAQQSQQASGQQAPNGNGQTAPQTQGAPATASPAAQGQQSLPLTGPAMPMNW